MAGGIPEDFHVEQILCAGCRQPTVRLGLPVADATRRGGKEPVLCGACLVAVKERLEKMRGQESEEDLPDWGSDSSRSLQRLETRDENVYKSLLGNRASGMPSSQKHRASEAVFSNRDVFCPKRP
jgi:hypothetical protein